MSDAGVAFVQLVPSMRGFSKDVTKGLGKNLTGPLSKAGEQAGGAASDGVSRGMGRGGGKITGAVGKIAGILKTGLATAGLVAGGLLVAGLSKALDQEAATDKLVAQLGGGEFAEEMGTVAGNLYKDAFGDSTADTGAALKTVLEQSLLPDGSSAAEWEAITAQALTYSDVMDQDVNGSVLAVSTMLKNGLIANASEGFDLLTVGTQQGLNGADDLLATMNEYPGSFKTLGLSGEQAMGLLKQGLDAGARDSDKVADALKEISIRGQDMSASSAEAFGSLGLNADEMFAKFAAGGPEAAGALDMVLDSLREMEPGTERNAAAVGLFGTQAEDLGDALFALDFDTAAAGLGEIEGATDGLGSAYDNASTKIESFKRKAMDKLIKFVGGTVIPAFEGLAKVLGPPIQGALEAIRNVVDKINFDRIAAGWQIFKDALSGDLGFDFEGTMGTVQDLGTAFRDFWENSIKPMVDFLKENEEIVVGALAAIALVITAILIPALIAMVVPIIAAAAPFIALIAAAALLGAGLTWLYNNVEVFRDFVNEALPQVVEIFQGAFELVKTVVSNAVAFLSQLWTWFGDDIIRVIQIAWDLVSSVISGALDIISGIIKVVTGVISGDWSQAWEGIKQILSGAWTIIKAVIRTALNSVKLLFRLAWRAVKNIVKDGITNAKNEVKSGFTAIVGFFRKLPGRIRGAFSTLASAIKSPFSSAFNAIKRLWNSTAGGFGFSIPDWVPGVGGKSFSIPNMHTGGIVPGIGDKLRVLEGGEGVFTKEQMAAMGPAVEPGTGATIVIRADGETAYLRWIKSIVRSEGGDVNVAFGGTG